MKPFKVRERKEKRKLLTFRNIAIGLIIFVVSILWYSTANNVDNNQVLKEGTEDVK